MQLRALATVPGRRFGHRRIRRHLARPPGVTDPRCSRLARTEICGWTGPEARIAVTVTASLAATAASPDRDNRRRPWQPGPTGKR